jgi:hypothetical protein
LAKSIAATSAGGQIEHLLRKNPPDQAGGHDETGKTGEVMANRRIFDDLNEDWPKLAKDADYKPCRMAQHVGLTLRAGQQYFGRKFLPTLGGGKK